MLRPLCLFSFVIASFIVMLVVPAFLVPLWIKKVHEIAAEANVVSYNSHQGILSLVENTAKMLLPTNQEIRNLQRYLSSSLNATDPPFSAIETKVAPTLFLAFSTIQHLSQISFIALDGLFFSYYIKDDQPYAAYSNTTFSSFRHGAVNNYTWYTQPVNQDTGKRFGHPLRITPRSVFNSSWFREALRSEKGHVSVGAGLMSNDHDLLLIDIVGIDQRSALSLGFPLKPLTDFLWTSINEYGGALYLAGNDGTSLLSRGIPNTRMLRTNSSASIQLIHPSDHQISKVGDLICQPNDGSVKASVMEIWKKKYLFYCSSLEIVGVPSVFAIALPYKGLSSIMHQNVGFSVVLLIMIMAVIAMSICTFIFSSITAARREMYLCAALIKQLEATQQAERKSMNKSLAFARASHDVRGSLSAIIGLVQNTCAAAGSDLQTNLRLAETCAQDLLGMLSSILDKSKIEAGKTQLEEEEFDLEQLLEDVVDLYYSVGIKKGVDVLLDPCDGTARKCGHVKGDRGKLKQILSNLLSNAVKFTVEGHASVRAWARKPCYENEILASNRRKAIRCMPCLLSQIDDKTYKELKAVNNVQQDPNCMEFIFEVSDTGKGIPKEKHKMVFENYVQVKDTALGLQGTGLGLGIVQSLVRIMGGEISIVEKELGEKGTCFRFNTFFTLCGSEPGTDSREDDNLYLQAGPSAHTHCPKAEGASQSQVVLFLLNEERSKISKNFMESLGVKVSVVRHFEQLSETLKRVRQNLTLSSAVRINHQTRSMPSNSTCRSKELPLSALDGIDVAASSVIKNASNFILVVIDTGAGPFREISRAVAEFRRDLCSSSNRIVWIHRPDSSSLNVLALKEDKLSPMDVILSKPLHGSCLFRVIGLLPEFGGSVPAAKVIDNTHAISRGSKIDDPEKIKSIHHSTDQNREIQETVSSNREKPLSGKKVLVAEDSRVLRQLAKALVSQLGADTETCENGEEATQMVYRKLREGRKNGARQMLPYDYILMDCEMAEMDGYEATRRIREEEKNYGVYIPIIAVTAHTAVEETKKMTEAGMDYYLSKPLGLKQLLNAISFIHAR